MAVDHRLVRGIIAREFKRALYSSFKPFGRPPTVTRFWLTEPREKPTGPEFCPDDPTEVMVARRDPCANFLGAKVTRR